MNKPKLVIIEGAAGTGKSTVTNILREKMLSTTLIRLSGIRKDIENSKVLSFAYHDGVLSMIKKAAETQMNWVMDRSYLSDYVYTKLGYKDYSFRVECTILTDKLVEISELYDVTVVLLKTTGEQYKKRLKRDKAEYQKFSIESSLEQQQTYEDVITNLPKAVKKQIIDTTDLSPDEVASIILDTI